MNKNLEQAGQEDIEQGQRDEDLPAECHQLVITVSWQGGADPDKEEQEAVNLEDKPEGRKKRNRKRSVPAAQKTDGP